LVVEVEQAWAFELALRSPGSVPGPSVACALGERLATPYSTSDTTENLYKIGTISGLRNF